MSLIEKKSLVFFLTSDFTLLFLSANKRKWYGPKQLGDTDTVLHNLRNEDTNISECVIPFVFGSTRISRAYGLYALSWTEVFMFVSTHFLLQLHIEKV